MSTFRYISPTKQYHPGTKLELWPYKPAEPHGRSQYTRNPLPRDLHPGWMRDFDPTTLNNRAEEAAVIEIDEMIHGGDNHLAQILACNLVEAPKHQRSPEELTQLTNDGKPVKVQIVAEIFDPEFYPGGTGAPYDNDEQADGNLSCADAALGHLFTKGLTGHPHFAPQYYGCWVARIQARQRSTGPVTERFVGVVLREHVIGHSIEALCHRDEYGQLLPFEGCVFFHDSDDAEEGQVRLELEKEVCQDILKQALHGIVCHLHVGVKHEMFEPKNIYLTMRDGDFDLEKPRAVLLGHMLAQVWSKTTEAQGPLELKQLLEHLAYPPHPRLRFGFRAVDDFVGWFPSPPDGWYGNEPATFDSKKEYEDWIVSEEVFGPLVEAAEVEKGLEDGAEWPYPYGKYSLFKSLDAVKEDLLRQRQEKRKLAEQQQNPEDMQKGR
ncbi:hypothetical protein CGCA056_v006375 [Colletotrichum aenigma]|uniref:uncharacterized protein n=1 Tax=Colletotrichum aenigma TaxID=1215731 RepID=UPI00187262AD|nr:uncharacterized protein CGCA056_v006375 [Colletotrichum aenigma]KAF5522504.1 hypothetical protein CGCA056_v006375 [Colletotrichum aenigma]